MAELSIWMNGLKVGVWGQTRTGQHFLRYDESWMGSPQARALSLSLPITAGTAEIRGEKVERFFDNLLPDTPSIRQRIRGRYHTRSTDASRMSGFARRSFANSVSTSRTPRLPLSVIAKSSPTAALAFKPV